MRFAGPASPAAIAALMAAAAAASCAGQSERPLPAWFVERAAALNEEGYPRLENVPNRVDANTDQAHWDGVTRELDAAAAEMSANPRSAPPPSAAEQEAAAAAFEDAARAEIDGTRPQ